MVLFFLHFSPAPQTCPPPPHFEPWSPRSGRSWTRRPPSRWTASPSSSWCCPSWSPVKDVGRDGHGGHAGHAGQGGHGGHGEHGDMVEIIFTCGCWPRTAQLRWGRAVLRQTNQSALFPSITSGVKEGDRQITFIPIHPSSNFELYSQSWTGLCFSWKGNRHGVPDQGLCPILTKTLHNMCILKPKTYDGRYFEH